MLYSTYVPPPALHMATEIPFSREGSVPTLRPWPHSSTDSASFSHLRILVRQNPRSFEICFSYFSSVNSRHSFRLHFFFPILLPLHSYARAMKSPTLPFLFECPFSFYPLFSLLRRDPGIPGFCLCGIYRLSDTFFSVLSVS